MKISDLSLHTLQPVLTEVTLMLPSLLMLLYLFHLILRELRRAIYFSGDGYGPPSFPFIGCLISFYNNRHRLLDWYTDLLSESATQTIVIRRCGAPRTIVTANPENVEYILKTNFDNFPKGRPFTELLGDFLGCGIFNVDGEIWRTQRKLASHEFTARSLREFVVNALEEEVKDRLLPELAKSMTTEKSVDLQELLRRFSFNIVCKITLGIDDPSVEEDVSALSQAFDLASEICAKRAAAPVFAVWKIKRLLGIGSEKKLKDAMKQIHAFVDKIIHNKEKEIVNEKGGTSTIKDLLSRLILDGHDKEVIRDMVISFIMAGRDTTSAVMTWLFWLLSCHPEIQSDVVKEISMASENEDMRLLRACIFESMRLYPPVAWDSKHALTGDCLPDGTPVNKGDRVTYFPYGMGRMETLWGKDRFEFRPDRWFDKPGQDSGGLQRVSSFKFPVFQAGPRVCLGKEMAFIQMKYVLASVLRRFEIKPVCMNRPVFVPFLTAYMAGGFKVSVHTREEADQRDLKKSS